MIKNVVLLIGISACLVWLSGCEGEGLKLVVPMKEDLDSPSVYFLHKRSEDSREVTVYLDPAISEKHLMTTASGGICNLALIDVHLGRGISDRLQEGFKEVFPKVTFVTTDSIPEGSMSMSIEIKEVKIGFEFSPVSKHHGCNETSVMDKGWVNLVTAARLLDQTGKEVWKKDFTYENRKEAAANQPSYREEVLEMSLNKVIVDFLDDIRKATNKATNNNLPCYISIKMDRKALQGEPLPVQYRVPASEPASSK